MKVYFDLFLAFVKIGLFAIGGEHAVLPLIREEVLGHSWMSNADLISFLAVCRPIPGPMSLNMAVYAGLKAGGLFGQLFAILGVLFPSFLIMFLIAVFYDRLIRNRTVSYILQGLKPAVVAMIASAFLTLGREVFFPEGKDSAFGSYSAFICAFIFIVCLILNHFRKGPVTIIAVSGVLGIIAGILCHI